MVIPLTGRSDLQYSNQWLQKRNVITLRQMLIFALFKLIAPFIIARGHRGRDCMVVGFTTTCSISAYHH
jgi:hypothetical protein